MPLSSPPPPPPALWRVHVAGKKVSLYGCCCFRRYQRRRKWSLKDWANSGWRRRQDRKKEDWCTAAGSPRVPVLDCLTFSLVTWHTSDLMDPPCSVHLEFQPCSDLLWHPEFTFGKYSLGWDRNFTHFHFNPFGCDKWHSRRPHIMQAAAMKAWREP